MEILFLYFEKILTKSVAYCIIILHFVFGDGLVSSSNINKDKLVEIMAHNLSVLRMKLNLSQENLAEIIGVTRQTISAIENEQRSMTWPVFMALVLVFLKNKETKRLMVLFRIYTKELDEYITF